MFGLQLYHSRRGEKLSGMRQLGAAFARPRAPPAADGYAWGWRDSPIGRGEEEANMSKKTRGVGPHSRRIAWSRSHTSPYQRRGVQCPICLWSGNKEADFKMHWKERHEASPDAIMQAHSTC